MHFSLTSIVRMVAFLAVGVSAVAVGVSRSVPRVSEVRTPAPGRFHGVNGSVFSPPRAENFILDAETGKLRLPAVPPGYSLEYVSGAPWTDANGDHELVGRLKIRADAEAGRDGELAGLARLRFRDGSLVGETFGSPIVSGRPAWLHSAAPTLVFPAGDGKLYLQKYTNGGDEPVGSADATESGPREVTWGCERPGRGQVLIGDPACPETNRLKGLVLVSLSSTAEVNGRLRYGASLLWWLKIDADRRTIVDAGPLVDFNSPEGGPEPADERLPAVAETADGRLVVGFLRRKAKSAAWDAWVGPLSVDRETGKPAVRDSDLRRVTEDCAVCAPAFSADGRVVYQVSRFERPENAVMRFEVDDVLRPARVAALAATVAPAD